MAQLADWAAMTGLLADQVPDGEPGVVGGYHAITQGYLIGEVVRRVTGRGLAAFFAEEVAGPLGADFHLGLPAEHEHRVAPVIPPTDLVDRAPGNPVVPAEIADTELWRRSEIPSVNGFGNARSVAAVQSVLVCGGNGLLSTAGGERALEEQFCGTDRILGTEIRYGMGYRLMGRTCSWGGWGGSVVMVDFDRRMTVSYVMNRMLETDDQRGLGIVMAAY